MFNIDQIVKALQTDPNVQRTAATGAAGLAAGMLFSGGNLGRLAGNVLKVGAVAAVGGLAYSAWKNHQAKQSGQVPPEDAFIPPVQAGYQREELGKSLVRAMISAAKADGKIDAEEKERIFAKLETMPLSSEEKAFVFDELSSPLDIATVADRADTPEHASEIYAASLVAMRADTDVERAYLVDLAQRLKLEPGLVVELHKAAGVEPPATPEPIGLSAAGYVSTSNV